MIMRINSFTSAVRIGAVVALLGAMVFQSAQAEEKPGARRASRGFNLLRAAQFGTLEVNRVFCGINNLGEVCVDPTNSPGIGGGFWPKGSPNQYIFNSGLQLAGIINAPGFAWHGDTTGVFFMDPKGTEPGGDPVSLTYNSLDPADLENWPGQAMVWDPEIYSPVLLGRKTLAQQDLWVRTWDGNPVVAGGRVHPLGVLVEERGLAWNFPSGNEDIVYFVYNFYNISAKNRAVYNTLPAIVQDSVFDIALDYISATEDRFGVTFPADGYTVTDFYGAFFMDPDVGAAIENYSSAILPFEMAIAYKSNWLELLWSYPPGINGPPFNASPGIVGVKYLKSPIRPGSSPPEEIGLTMFSNTLNTSTGFPDPDGVIQMWRYISGNISVAAGDNPCDFPDPKARGMCFLYQEEEDTRFYQSSGPFDLVPGEFSTIVVAYVHGAPVSAPLVASGQIGGDLKPLIPMTGTQIFEDDCAENPLDACIRTIDSIAGWLTHSDVNGNGKIDQDEVVSVKRSLLDKALVAQAVFDNKFLLPFAPDVPPFFLVPGDNVVSVIWEKSPSETLGDPFYAVASDPLSPLFDANFRQFDVEGYRIYRGRTSGQLQMIAVYDYAGTAFTDAVGNFWYGTACAPNLIPPVTSGCPSFPNDVPLVGDVIQTRPGGKVQFIDLSINLAATDPASVDTAVTGAASGAFPALSDAGVPFAFVDLGVRNAFTYHYAVTAFDVNSYASGPGSLESARVTQSVRPRSTASNEVAAGAVLFELIDRDGNVLDVAAPYPTIDPATGTFSGPMPPSGGAAFESLGAEFFAANLVTPGSVAYIQIDSLHLAYYHTGTYYLSGTGTGVWSFGPNLPLGEEDGGAVMGPAEALLPADQALADSLGLGPVPWSGKFSAQVTANPVTFQSRDADWHTSVDGAFFEFTDPPMNSWAGSRWFDGANETMADPATGIFNFGQLTGVNTIYQPVPCWAIIPGADDGCPGGSANALFRRNMQTVYHGTRAADIQVYWGAPGVVDSVIDVTHNLVMPFVVGPEMLVGWGIRNDIAASSLVQAPADGLIDQYDFGHGPCFPERPSWTSPNCASFPYLQTATLEPVDTGPIDGVADGNGFAMYINGHFFIFQTATLPTNTVWTLRTYMGHVTKATGSYVFTPKPANAPLPGLRLRGTTGEGATFPDTIQVSLDSVHTVPDPYYVTTSLEITPDTKLLQFVNLPTQAIIRIYSLSGILVSLIEHNDPAGGGTATWDLRNRNSQIVASGVYFYHVETAAGQEKMGRFTIVNFAQ